MPTFQLHFKRGNDDKKIEAIKKAAEKTGVTCQQFIITDIISITFLSNSYKDIFLFGNEYGKQLLQLEKLNQ